jgi:hypothetical protein|nr:MAG TPA: hypothetical protein [Caudoviricetes sp.]
MANNIFKEATFNFIGHINFGKEPVSIKNARKDGTGNLYRKKLGVGIKHSTSCPFLSMEVLQDGMNPEKFKVLGLDNKLVEVPYGITTNPDVMAKIADYTKITIDLETDFEKKKEYVSLIYKVRSHEFKLGELEKKKESEGLTTEEETAIEEHKAKIEEYNAEIAEKATNRHTFIMKDAIDFINANLPEMKKHKVRVTGNAVSNYYNDVNKLQYVPKTIEYVPDDTPTCLKVEATVFFEKKAMIDDEKNKKVMVNGYLPETRKKVTKLYPTMFVIDYNKLDLSQESHQTALDFMKSTFEGKDKKSVYRVLVDIDVIDGAEVKEFTEADLTKEQKQAIALGLYTFEDFKPKNPSYGANIAEYRVVKPVLKEEYSSGAVVAFASKDLVTYLPNSEPVAEPPKEEKNEEPAPAENSQSVDLDALFGA